MEKTKFLGSKEACKILGIHPRTLYLWEKNRNNKKSTKWKKIL